MDSLFASALFLESLVSIVLATLLIPTVRETATLALHVKSWTVVLSTFLVVACCCSLLFLAMRLGVRLWAYCDRLRRTRLRWALTYAQVIVVATAAFSLSFVVLILIVANARNFSFGPLFAILLLFCLFVSIMIAFVILPPFALFSHLFIRPTTRRIEQLAAATSVLRAGNYQVRVPVEGEDELARLQADFNAMASHLERTMRELQQERDTVAALFQERRDLIANVSHDLRTPVTTVRGYLESTLSNWNGHPPQTLQKDLQVMQQQTIRLQSLIDDLFTLARVEVDRLEMRCLPTNVEALTRRVVETIAPLAWQGSRVEVHMEVAAQVPLALVDASRLEQVLQNLLHNGVRHTPPGGIVVAVVDAEPDMVTIQVKDTGEGIASAELERIWERFYRTECSRTKQPHNGAGLGLAIVKELTEAMGGNVGVTSTTGEGACFTVRVPRAV